MALSAWSDTYRAAALPPTASGAGRTAVVTPPLDSPRLSPVRPWARIDALVDVLDTAIPSLAAGDASALARIQESVAELQRLCALAPDALLAVPLCLRRGHRVTRQSVSCAVLLAFMLTRIGVDRPTRDSALCAALTMDVGDLELNERLLEDPTPLLASERSRLLDHPRASAQRLRELGVDDPRWLRAVEEHHEQCDGAGYPAALRGDRINPLAQALMLAARWCSAVSPRAYRVGAPPDTALAWLAPRLSLAADPRMVAVLVATVGPMPPGSRVRLVGGEQAVVVGRTGSPRAPLVRLLSASGDGPLRATAEPRSQVAEVLATDAADTRADPHRLWEALETGLTINPSTPRA